MDGIEIRARREALGLTVAELGCRLDPPVVGDVVTAWEAGELRPGDSVTLHMVLCDVEDFLLGLIDQIAGNIVHASAVRNERSVEVRTYLSDDAYWAADVGAKNMGVPASLHRVATAAAALEVRQEHSVDAVIISG